MSDNTKISLINVSFCEILTLLFIGLKLTHHIDWSWWWVLSPVWIPLALVFLFCSLVGIFAAGAAFLSALLEYFEGRKRKK